MRIREQPKTTCDLLLRINAVSVDLSGGAGVGGALDISNRRALSGGYRNPTHPTASRLFSVGRSAAALAVLLKSVFILYVFILSLFL